MSGAPLVIRFNRSNRGLLMKLYKESHNKYFPNEKLWNIAVNQGIGQRDYGAIKFAVERQSAEVGGNRVAVDIDAHWMADPFGDFEAVYRENPVVGDEIDYSQELKFLRELGRMRDKPVVEIMEELPKAYSVSYTHLTLPTIYSV